MTNYNIPQPEFIQQNRKLNYSRQDISSVLAFKSTGHSVKGCMRSVVGGSVKLILNSKNNRAHYSGLLTCGSVWDCPVCSSKIAYKRADEIKTSVDNWSDMGGGVLMVTYTIRHSLNDKLSDLMTVMTNAIRFVHSGAPYQRLKAFYGIVGGITSTEVLFNPSTGWHYHKHALIYINKFRSDYKDLEKWIYRRYSNYLKSMGYDVLPGVGVKVTYEFSNSDTVANYISKWGVQKELTRNDKKSSVGYSPFELLDNEKLHYRFIEYSIALKGKRKITWSKGLRKITGLCELEIDDEKIAIEKSSEYDEILYDFDYYQWRYILDKKLRADILNWAEKGSFSEKYKALFSDINPVVLELIKGQDWKIIKKELSNLRDNGICSAIPNLMGILVNSGYFQDKTQLDKLINSLSV